MLDVLIRSGFVLQEREYRCKGNGCYYLPSGLLSRSDWLRRAVHGERVWRPCMASGCAGLCAGPGFYSLTSTYRLHTTHHTTIHTRVLHLTDYLTHLTYGCNPYTLTRACTLRLNPSLGLPSAGTLRLNPSLGLPSAGTLRLNPSLGLPSARTLRFPTPAWEYRPLRPL
jgi:hypothetical protein